jgi:hypothetical protein
VDAPTERRLSKEHIVGFVARLKETAQQGIDKGRATVDERQAKQATSELLRNLGLVAYAQRTGQADAAQPDEAAQLDEMATTLVQRLKDQVAAHGPLPEPKVPAG